MSIKRYTEDEARASGFSDAEIESSRSHPDGYIGKQDGVMCFNVQAEISMGGPAANGYGPSGRLPDRIGDNH